MNKKLVAAFIIFLAFAGRGIAQPKDAMRELIAINEHFLHQDTLKFHIEYYYEEDDSTGVITDSLIADCLMNKGMSYMKFTTFTRINNDKYNFIVDDDEKNIFIQNATDPVSNYMGARFTEADFMNNYVDSATVSDSGAADYAIINITFKDAAPYHWYRIAYNTTTNYPAYIQYSMKKDMEEAGIERAVRLKVMFSSYGHQASSANTFDISTWAVRKKEGFVVQPAYNEYTITDLTTKEQ